MRLRSAFGLLGMLAVAAAFGCSSSSSTPVAPIRGAGAPTASPTGAASATPVRTATPTAAPSATPVPSASPTEGTVGNITCSAAPITVPGVYMSIETEGVVSGTTYTGDAEDPGSYEVDEYTQPTPSPTPTATTAASPTPVPTVSPTFTPGPTATPVMVTVYYGEYDYQNFSGREQPSPQATYTVSANDTGCFELIMYPFDIEGARPDRSHAGGQRRRPFQSDADNAFGIGVPNEGDNDYAETEIDNGGLGGISIQNLSPSTGSGTFEFATAIDADIEGTLTITGSQTFTVSDFLKSRSHVRLPHGLSARWKSPLR